MLHIRLKDRRKEKKLSQEFIAEKLGITRQGYGHYETGRNEPDSETLLKISNILDCSTDYLHGKTDKPNYEDDGVNVFYRHGGVTEDELEHLEEELKRFRELKKRWQNQQGKDNKGE